MLQIPARQGWDIAVVEARLVSKTDKELRAGRTDIASRHRDHAVLVQDAGLLRGFVIDWRKWTLFLTTATLDHLDFGVAIVVLLQKGQRMVQFNPRRPQDL